GDFDNNGTLDLVTADINNGTVSIFLGQGNGRFAGVGSFSVGEGPSWVAVGDFDGDGVLDLAVTNSRSRTVSVLRGKGDGRFQPATDYNVDFGCWSVTVSDLNEDGILDLIVANASLGSRSLSILMGLGDGHFQAARTIR